jgi:CheY-like chemotaxis protein
MNPHNMKRKLGCILVVDDDEPTGFLYRMIIEAANCTDHIEVVQNGQDAFSYLTHDMDQPSPGHVYPDLIFLDINMPRMDGWEFIAQYHAWKKAPPVKPVVIMLSTSLNPDDERKAKETPGIAGFMNKPLDEDMLNEIITGYFPE